MVVVHNPPEGTRSLIAAPALGDEDPESMRVGFGRDTETVADVLAFTETTSFTAGWRLVANTFDRSGGGYELDLPAEWTVWSTPRRVDWCFEMTPPGDGPPDAMLYVQWPLALDRAPALERLVGVGMDEVQRGTVEGRGGPCRFIELSYEHDGVEWRQRRYLVPVGDGCRLLATVQGLASEPRFEAADAIVASLRERTD